MQIPLQVSFHGLEHSDALYESIRKKAEQLDRYCDGIIARRRLEDYARTQRAAMKPRKTPKIHSI